MASVTILGRKCDLLLLVASAALCLFIVSITMNDCKGCSGGSCNGTCSCNGKGCSKCNGGCSCNGKGCSKCKGGCSCNGKGCSKCTKENIPAGNIVGAGGDAFSEFADV